MSTTSSQGAENVKITLGVGGFVKSIAQDVSPDLDGLYLLISPRPGLPPQCQVDNYINSWQVKKKKIDYL